MQVSMFHCPFLGTRADPLNRLGHAADDATCHSIPSDTHSPSHEHQEHYCLTSGFLECPRYVEAQQLRLHRNSNPPMVVTRHRTERPKVLISTWLMLAGAGLLAGVVLTMLGFLAFKYVPVAVGALRPKVSLMALTAGATQTATPVVIVVTATPVPTATVPSSSTLSPTSGLALVSTPNPGSTPSAPTVAPSSHVVQRGETLFMIARLHGVSVDDLAKLNNLVDRNNILVGQRLLLPSYAGTPGPTVTATGTPSLMHTPAPTSTSTAVSATLTETSSPTATHTSISTCNGDEAMSFNPVSPISGDTVIISVTSAKAHTDVKLARGPTSMEAPYEVLQGGKGWIWRWRLTNAAVGRYDFNFWVGNSPVCTANGFTVSQ